MHQPPRFKVSQCYNKELSRRGASGHEYLRYCVMDGHTFGPNCPQYPEKFEEVSRKRSGRGYKFCVPVNLHRGVYKYPKFCSQVFALVMGMSSSKLNTLCMEKVEDMAITSTPPEDRKSRAEYIGGA